MRTEGEDVLLGLKIYRIFLMDAVLLAEKKFIFLLLIWLLGNWVFSTLKCTLHLTFEGSLCQVTQAATELESQAGARSHLVQCFQFTKVGAEKRSEVAEVTQWLGPGLGGFWSPLPSPNILRGCRLGRNPSLRGPPSTCSHHTKSETHSEKILSTSPSNVLKCLKCIHKCKGSGCSQPA